ncbi:hypothetical protein [Streptomyces sp. NPDC016845]|uniref:hypothetical protein n=1 Tax=Streptomyces sp. NPDC016845 TaxID=3364972 RepID=UPI0037985C31
MSMKKQTIGTVVVVIEQRLSTMVLVIRTGGAGLRAAIEPAEAGVDVLAVGITHEPLPPVPDAIASLMEDVSTDGKLAE